MALDALSEGEAQRFDLACFIALGDLIENFSGIDLGFRVFDEPLAGLDEQGQHAVFKMLTDLNRQVFLIDHNATFANQFESVLTVEKTDGVSRIN